MVTQHHCAVLLNKDTFARDFTCTPIPVLCSLRYPSWAVEGMVVTPQVPHGSGPFVLPRYGRQRPHQQRVRRAEVCPHPVTVGISPLEAAFSPANLPWPTAGVAPLWSPGEEAKTVRGPNVAGFVGLPKTSG